MSEKKDQITTGIRAIFKNAVVYKAFQRAIGIEKAFKNLIGIMKPTSDTRFLDIGCGEGGILEFLPEGIQYVGYDLSKEYIDFAKKKFGNKGKFINQRVSAMDVEGGPFDIVMAAGLVHHLNDEEAKELFRIGYDCLKPGGYMYTTDNAYYKGQSPIARYISSKDRGQHVRYPEQYQQLALSAFQNVEVIIRHDMIRLPQTACILKCRKD